MTIQYKMKIPLYQVDAFASRLICELIDDRVLIYGKAVKYLEGKINIET